MEGEKGKRKRNRKKKNNNGQNKAVDEVSEDQQSQASTEVKDVEKESNDVCHSGNGFNGSNSAILVESEEQQWLRKEAILEETIRQLRAEKDNHINKEATLLGTVNQLHQENNLQLQKVYTLEKTIKQLRDKNNSYVQKEANLEMKIGQLQREKDSLVQKESHLEERISQLVDEKITWNLKEESLEDRIRHLEAEKHSLIQKEDFNTVMMGNLSDDIAQLLTQVVELEETRNNLLNENRQLMENISSLHLQIKDVQGIASTQPSPDKLSVERDELVGRLMEENADLVEKVSELLIRLDRRPSSVETASFSNPGSEFNEFMPKIGRESNSGTIEIVPIKEERNGAGNYRSGDVLPESSLYEESGEIVQIPLDENSILDLELQVAENGKGEEATPFSDAPLIGAPFRLISFVSRYVSGADLVEKNSLHVKP